MGDVGVHKRNSIAESSSYLSMKFREPKSIQIIAMKGNSFRTEINSISSYAIISKDRILTTGSCFAQQFGDWLNGNKFDVVSNPFGTTYNPISIHNNLLDTLTNTLNESLFVEQDEVFKHYDYHSQWWALEKKNLADQIHNQQAEVSQFIKKSNVVIITYGTAWVYSYKAEKKIVSNCHKASATLFEKRLLTVDEIIKSFNELYKSLKKLNPDTRFILTVSPVRHIKDTLQLNGVSKAALRLACDSIVNKYDKVDYFPSYEIMMDDLRDYRFYERDMIHPTKEAFDYISQKFSDQYFPADIVSFIEKWKNLKQALQHKPFHPGSSQHQLFLKDLLTKLKSIKEVSLDEEINLVQSQLTNA